MINLFYKLYFISKWVVLFNLIMPNKFFHLLLFPLIIFGNYISVTRYDKMVIFTGDSLQLFIFINVLFHIIMPIYIIKRDKIKYEFSINNGKNNLANYFIPTLLSLILYMIIAPINKIYFFDKQTFFIIAILLYILGCYFLK
jgi:hypothetical protein